MSVFMVWFTFVISAVVIVFAANQLAKYGDAIAIRTNLGGMFIGVLLMAAATSLPELLTSISALREKAPNLAAGNLLGSNTINMLLLAVVDVLNREKRILRKAAVKHALTGSLAVLLIGLVVFFIVADIQTSVGWMGLDSLILIGVYIVAVKLIQGNSTHSEKTMPAPIPVGVVSLWEGIVGFVLAAALLTFVTPIMVSSANTISDITGLGSSIIGTTLVALVTSLPELVTTIAAIKVGANDMAIGNLFGSNMFNMFAIGLTDVFYTEGRFLSAIDPSFLLVSMLGLIMTCIALVGNLARIKRRFWFMEIDSLVLVLVYAAGIWMLFSRS